MLLSEIGGKYRKLNEKLRESKKEIINTKEVSERESFFRELENEYKIEHRNNIENDDEYVYNMFYYEFNNHEYYLSYDKESLLNDLNITWENVESDKRLKFIYEQTLIKYKKDFEKENC